MFSSISMSLLILSRIDRGLNYQCTHFKMAVKSGRHRLIKTNLRFVYIFFLIDILVYYLFHLGFSPDKVNIWRNQVQTARNFFCAKYILYSFSYRWQCSSPVPIPTVYDRRATDQQQKKSLKPNGLSIHNITTYKTRGKWATSLTGEINLINKHILKAIIIDDFFQLLPFVKFHPDRCRL